MNAIFAGNRWLCTSTIALLMGACGMDAPVESTGDVEPAHIVAERVLSGDARPAPIHRYAFDGEGTAVRDSVGGADGSAVAAELRGDGALQLPGDGAYIELPGGLLSQRTSVTLEFWVAWHGDHDRRKERIFDVGGMDAEGEHVGGGFFLSPNHGDNGRPRVSFRGPTGDESQLFSWRAFPSARSTHVAVVLDGEERTMAMYLDGESLGSSPWDHSLAELGDENVWLGRSHEGSDPNLSATFDEFRIYDRALSSADVEHNYADGPDGQAPSAAAQAPMAR